ncbi:hypothetical protein CHS0354_042763 [Potamilus streckersoni]|uniref:FYVE-type domain-containing protein n=1 Tax=Potamilus streckersoni TaxID=2493646 RepID=A0AAE0SAH1_9BIVA|nr:hypothetical protein CHS0354_042763 [Potamilus streckersoni]
MAMFPSMMSSRMLLDTHIIDVYPLACLLANCHGCVYKNWRRFVEMKNRKKRDEVEFCLLLAECGHGASDTVLKEIYLYYKWIHSQSSDSHRQVLTLSTQLLTFIQVVMETDPAVGHALVCTICVQPSSQPTNNKLLQSVYINALNSLMDNLYDGEKNEMDGNAKKDIIDKIYTILSLFDPYSYCLDAMSLSVSQLFNKILVHCRRDEKWLKRGLILSCLLGRSDGYLVEEFCKISFNIDTKCTLTSCQTCIVLTEDQRSLLQVAAMEKEEERWKMFLLFCIRKQRQLLETAVETGLNLIKCGLFDKLKSFFSTLELYPLKPLVLLLGWNYCRNSSDAKELLDALWDEKMYCPHPAISKGCSKLAYHIDLIQWCLEKTKPVMSSGSEGQGPQHQRAMDLFQRLENYSVLYVLHQSTRLASLDQHEVLNLLHKRPLQSEAENSTASEKRKIKSVRFQLDNCTLIDLDTDEDISLDQRKDVSIFMGFCAVKNVMDAISFCGDYNENALMNPVRKTRKMRISEGTTSNSSSESDEVFVTKKHVKIECDGMVTHHENDDKMKKNIEGSFQKLYKEFVTDKLQCAKEFLAKLQPLPFRIEILENIFSLLFVTHEDIQELSVLSEYNSGEEHETEDKTQHTSVASETSTLSPAEEGVIADLHFELTNQAQNQNVSTAYDEPFEKKALKIEEANLTSVTHKLEKIQDKIQSFQDGSDTDQKLVLDYLSSVSTGSSSSWAKFGFLVNEYLVRDILSMLKECLVDLSSAKYQLLEKKGGSPEKVQSSKELSEAKKRVQINSSIEEPLTLLIKCSVTKEASQKRLATLTQYIHEAQWRYQMVVHEEIPKLPGEVLLHQVTASGDQSDEEVEIAFLDKSSRRRKKRFGRQSYSDTLSNVQESDSSQQGSVSRRQRSRIRTFSGQSRSSSHLRHSGIISSMLSSPIMLLNLAIRRGNHQQAMQVIKLFKLENHAETIEVYFSQAYSKALKNVQSLTDAEPSSLPSWTPGRLSMKSLANVAAASIATVSITTIVDDLLSFPMLPQMPKMETDKRIPVQISQNLEPGSIPMMILTDLACTAGTTWKVCNHLMDNIKSRYSRNTAVVNSSSSGDTVTVDQGRKSRSEIRGLKHVLSEFEQLVHLGADEPFPGSEQISLVQQYRKSLQHFLTQASLPLTAERCKNYVLFCRSMLKLVGNVDISLEEKSKEGSRDNIASHHDNSPTRSRSSSVKQNPLHSAMKQLIHLVEKDVPAGGILSIFNRSSSGIHPRNKNYLLSLYDHCKELAFLVAESEAKSKETMVIPTNYFKMLEEGPIRILGRLMFYKKMQPAKLEKVAKKLSLNLTHIIVYSCCVKIPSKHMPLLSAITQQESPQVINGKMIHNSGISNMDPSGGTSKSPELCVRNLLTRLVHLMKDFAGRCNARGFFDYTSAGMLIETSEYHNIISGTRIIQDFDLNLLKDMDEKRCFFGNLQNLMSIHCFLYHFEMQSRSLKIEADGKKSHKNRLPWKPYSEMNLLEQMIWLSTFAYKIGQLGNVSLFDLKYIINRCGLVPSLEWEGMLKHGVSKIDQMDPWFALAPTPDPCLLFVTTSCCVSSVPVQILVPELVKGQLQMAMRNYLQVTVSPNTSCRVIHVPELLMWHKCDFSSEQEHDCYKAENEGLIHFILDHLSGDKQKALMDLLHLDKFHGFSESIDISGKKELPFRIEIVPFDRSFLCSFDFTSLVQLGNELQTLRRTSSLPHFAENISGDLSSGHFRDKEDTTYKMTPLTLDYIKSDCPIVATLVSLNSSDEFDDVQFHLERGHFDDDDDESELSRCRSPSDMSIVDIRSYRYQKLSDNFPTLKRHLLNYIVPIAGTEDPEILRGGDPILKFVTSNITDKFKSIMLTLHDSIQFYTFVTEIVYKLFIQHKWQEILGIIDSIPVCVFKENSQLQNIHDMVLSCMILRDAKKGELSKSKSEQVMGLVHRVLSQDQQARMLLSVHQSLHIEHNMDLFEMCLCQPMTEELQLALRTKFDEIRIYYQIAECVKVVQLHLSLELSGFITEEEKQLAKKKHARLDRFTDWGQLVEWTQEDPQEVLNLLLDTGDFETARSWAKMRKLENLCQVIEEKHIIWLLNSKPPNTTKVFMIFETLKENNISACLTICKKFLETLNNEQDVVFVASYMLNQLISHLSSNEVDQIRLTLIGAKMLLCLPSSMRSEYSHLVTHPTLILEQLLMNMKPDLASKAYKTVRADFSLIQSPTFRFTGEQFNKLVTTYAVKSLEFTVVQVVNSERERSLSRASFTSIDRRDVEGEQSRAGSPQIQPSYPESIQIRRRSADFVSSSRLLSASSGTSPVRRLASLDKFVMPAEPPSKDKWVPDSSESVCMVCKEERFSMFNRRHHCRRCGRVVCATCSQKTTIIKGVSARTCDDCYHQMFSTSDKRGSVADLYHHLHKDQHSGTSLGTRTISQQNFPIYEEHRPSLSEIIHHTKMTWKLQLDQEVNESLRDDFYFEQAPSTSLCTAILDLHGNPRECGQLILKLCDDLSMLLKPIDPGIPNPEVDYNLIISMIKYLLFHAKMKFIKCGENHGMTQCDQYQGLVDLLGLLVSANYRDLPSIHELTKVDSVSRLRDKLIEDERLSLAMEVSTKCGLDPTGVWVAWGMSCLQSGDFPGAREKFSRCLRAPKDKNMHGQVSKVLSDIVECLETMPGTGSMEFQLRMLRIMESKIQMILANPGSIKNLIMTSISPLVEEDSMESLQFQECVYYLRTYGTYLAMVDFHRKHSYWMKAVQYILDHKCSIEVFVEGLLKPSLESGELGKLMDQMLLLDPTLESWNHYLTAACRYFVKMKLHHVLYDFQLFMKDFIRAGMTCFTYFYTHGARSYLDLAKSIQHLFSAQQHMQAYLDPTQWGNVRHPLQAALQTLQQGLPLWKEPKTDNPVRLVKTQEEVKKYIRTIALQIEVTQFLHACLTNTAGEAASMALDYAIHSGSAKLPTLFSSSSARMEIVIMVLLSGSDVELAFDLGSRIIKEYKLGAVGIFTHVAREMAKHQRYDDIRRLLDCVVSSGMGDDDTNDEIVGACVLVLADIPSEAKEAENIIKWLKKDSNKVNAYILCGKLRSAYLMAVKGDRVEDVKRIQGAAQRMGQTAVVTICTKWLQQKGEEKPT